MMSITLTIPPIFISLSTNLKILVWGTADIEWLWDGAPSCPIVFVEVDATLFWIIPDDYCHQWKGPLIWYSTIPAQSLNIKLFRLCYMLTVTERPQFDVGHDFQVFIPLNFGIGEMKAYGKLWHRQNNGVFRTYHGLTSKWS